MCQLHSNAISIFVDIIFNMVTKEYPLGRWEFAPTLALMKDNPELLLCSYYFPRGLVGRTIGEVFPAPGRVLSMIRKLALNTTTHHISYFKQIATKDLASSILITKVSFSAIRNQVVRILFTYSVHLNLNVGILGLVKV